MSFISTLRSGLSAAEKDVAPAVQEVVQAAAPVVEQAAAPVVQAAATAAAPAAEKIFSAAIVDIRNELPELMSALGVNTSDESSVLHATLTLVVSLLEAYGPAEIRTVLTGSASTSAAK